MLVEAFINKGKNLVEMEIENTKLRIIHPEMSIIAHKNKPIPGLKWKITQRDLVELATAIFAAKIAFKSGKGAAFNEIVEFLEYLFSKEKVKTMYDIKSQVVDRQHSTKFLDMLRKAYLEYADSKL